MNEVTNTEQKRVNPVVQFKRDLNTLIDRKELALPTNVKPEAFRNAAIVAVQDNPEILNCNPATVMKSIRTIAAAGLVPDGREAAIVPFFTKEGKVAQAMPMVFGLIKMARRSGDVADIRAHIVYQNELDEGRFEYIVGDEETLRHEPILFGDKGEAVAAYAIAKLKDGTIVREFMDAKQIDKVRRSSPQQRKHEKPNGIWQQWTEEMWRKTVIRRLCKRLDLSSEDMRRILVEDEANKPADFKDVTPEEPEQEKNLAQRLAERRESAHEPQEEAKPVDGEVMPPEGEDKPHEFDPDAVDPFSDEYEEGRKAFAAALKETHNPHETKTLEHNNWLGGWKFAQKEAAE